MALAVAAITEATTVTISLKVLVTMLGLASSLIGVYVASLRRDDRLASRIEDLERWEREAWGGVGGFKHQLNSLRKWQSESRGAARARKESSSQAYRDDPYRDHEPKRHHTLGPGNDTLT